MKETTAPVPSPAATEAIQLRKAIPADIEAIFALVNGVAQTTTVLPRTHESIVRNLHHFVVAERAGTILGCGALGIFTRTLAEVKSLVVAEGTRGQGIGGQVVGELLHQARESGIRRVFALTDNARFFQRLGFSLVDKATLPHKVWNECIRCPKFLNCTEDAVDFALNADRRK